MAHTSKREVIANIFTALEGRGDLDTTLNKRLLKLMNQDRITSGCYYVHNTYDNWEYKHAMELIQKCNRSRTSIGDVKLYSLERALEGIHKHVAELEAFVVEQESLPFEETQMQVLKRSGELREFKDGVQISGPTDEEEVQ